MNNKIMYPLKRFLQEQIFLEVQSMTESEHGTDGFEYRDILSDFKTMAESCSKILVANDLIRLASVLLYDGPSMYGFSDDTQEVVLAELLALVEVIKATTEVSGEERNKVLEDLLVQEQQAYIVTVFLTRQLTATGYGNRG